MSDFSLMDAIECGIVKLFRVPLADNVPRGEMAKAGRRNTKDLDPLGLPTMLQTALEALYGHDEKTYRAGEKAGAVMALRFSWLCARPKAGMPVICGAGPQYGEALPCGPYRAAGGYELGYDGKAWWSSW